MSVWGTHDVHLKCDTDRELASRVGKESLELPCAPVWCVHFKVPGKTVTLVYLDDANVFNSTSWVKCILKRLLDIAAYSVVVVGVVSYRVD